MCYAQIQGTATPLIPQSVYRSSVYPPSETFCTLTAFSIQFTDSPYPDIPYSNHLYSNHPRADNQLTDHSVLYPYPDSQCSECITPITLRTPTTLHCIHCTYHPYTYHLTQDSPYADHPYTVYCVWCICGASVVHLRARSRVPYICSLGLSLFDKSLSLFDKFQCLVAFGQKKC